MKNSKKEVLADYAGSEVRMAVSVYGLCLQASLPSPENEKLHPGSPTAKMLLDPTVNLSLI